MAATPVYQTWSLDTKQKSIVSGYYTFRVSGPGPCRLSFKKVVNTVVPVVSDKGTSFRWRMTPELKAAFKYLSTGFVDTYVAPQYQQLFGKALNMDVVDDSLAYIRSSTLHLRVPEAIDSMESLELAQPYIVELELKSVGLKESRIQLNWKVTQVSVDDTGPGLTSPAAAAAMDLEADSGSDQDEDEVAEPSADDYADTLATMKETMATHVTRLQATMLRLSQELDACQELVESLAADSSQENLMRVYDSWTALVEP